MISLKIFYSRMFLRRGLLFVLNFALFTTFILFIALSPIAHVKAEGLKAEEFTKLGEFAIEECLVSAQSSYNETISKCLDNASSILSQIPTSSLADFSTPEEALARVEEFQKISKETFELVEKKKSACYGDELNGKYKKQMAECYAEGSFGSLWDKLPQLKEVLAGAFADYKNLSPQQGKKLASCVEEWSVKYDTDKISAQEYNALQNCFTGVGLKGIGSVYGATSIAIDCADDKLRMESVADVARLTQDATPEETAYIEQCVIKRLAPALTGVAILNIPFVAGWHNVFLFGQLMLSQPLFLLRRRKYKTCGKIFDSVTAKPVDLGSVRLLNNDTNKIIATMVTGMSGSYFFLPELGVYRVDVNKHGYSFPSSLATTTAKEPDHYFGEPIVIKHQSQVVDRHIPIDPHESEPSVSRFHLRKWRHRLAVSLGFVSPIISFATLFFSRSSLVVALFVFQMILLLVFIRLSRKERVRKFGVVISRNKKSLSGVVVSLFRRGDNKLLNYYVTDMFGRYYFPSVTGEFILTFSKEGYAKHEVSISFSQSENEKKLINIDITLLTKSASSQ